MIDQALPLGTGQADSQQTGWRLQLGRQLTGEPGCGGRQSGDWSSSAAPGRWRLGFLLDRDFFQRRDHGRRGQRSALMPAPSIRPTKRRGFGSSGMARSSAE